MADVGKEIKEGRHVGLDVYDLLIESFAIWVGKRAFGSFGPGSDYPPAGLLPQNAPIGISRP